MVNERSRNSVCGTLGATGLWRSSSVPHHPHLASIGISITHSEVQICANVAISAQVEWAAQHRTAAGLPIHPSASSRNCQTDCMNYAIQCHPLNSPMLSSAIPMEPGQLAVMTGKYWGPTPRVLTVSFMESPAENLRAKILTHMNAWNCSISFIQVPIFSPYCTLYTEGYKVMIQHEQLCQPS